MLDSGRLLVIFALVMMGLNIFSLGTNSVQFMAYNSAVAAFGVFVGEAKRATASLNFMIMLSFSFVADLVWLGLYGKSTADESTRTKFGLGLAIIALLVKVPSFFFAFKIFRDEGRGAPSYSAGPSKQPGLGAGPADSSYSAGASDGYNTTI
eukprot:EC791982.1.p1 GENE.EC791982.1~~EC791982.1.p1  ORF type:complete len:152 (+),score=51.13 EC791982.1:49-504(+)